MGHLLQEKGLNQERDVIRLLLSDGVVPGKFLPLLWFCNTGTKGAFPAQLPGLVVMSLSARKWMQSPDSVALVRFLLLQAESGGWGDEGELSWDDNSW